MHHIILPLDHPILMGVIGNPYHQPNLRAKVQEWLIENIGSERKDRLAPWNQDVWFQNSILGTKARIVHEVVFKYRDDAMLFKLTWV